MDPSTINTHKNGSQNEADYLSRHPINKSQSESNEEQIAEEYVNYIIANTVPKTMTLEEVKVATRKDQVLRGVGGGCRIRNMGYQ